ncbi:MAG: glycosyltransferase family 2 protein [Deltaproteobacteria bacterium]|nr:glycosyltransferase family 2 protein [Deltaproteobacteria bacterium]
MPKISVIIICYNRGGELRDCIQSILKQTLLPDEIIVVDNASTDGTEALFINGGECALPYVRYERLARNLGVAGGRNHGIRMAKGDILIFIDDDALLEPADAFAKTVERFEGDSRLGILAYKIINYYDKTIKREEFPHRDKTLDADREFETTYFVGAGHAIRKKLFDGCGVYPEDYFYGMEEMDLSFRALAAGWRIFFFPSAVVWHKKSPKGRVADSEKWIFVYRNRLAISYKYLRMRHFYVLGFIWFFKVWKESGSPATAIKGLFAFSGYRKGLSRSYVGDAAVRTIHGLCGRIWW